VLLVEFPRKCDADLKGCDKLESLANSIQESWLTLSRSPPTPQKDKTRPETVFLDQADVVLEGVIRLVPEANQPGLVLCHPHPLMGGSMEDSRIVTISKAAFAAGINTLRFNFRGVGQSQGRFGQGIGEIQDIITAMNYLRNHAYTDSSRIALLGYSFGGSIALAAAMDAAPTALVTVSAPFRIADLDPALVSDALRFVPCPTYVVHGRADRTINPVEAEAIYAKLQVKEKYLRLIKGANHFWTQRMETIVSMIIAFLRDKFQMK
jgi:alpha/beta superfamily hydrolase